MVLSFLLVSRTYSLKILVTQIKLNMSLYILFFIRSFIKQLADISAAATICHLYPQRLQFLISVYKNKFIKSNSEFCFFL